jgi:hypothetical protein
MAASRIQSGVIAWSDTHPTPNINPNTVFFINSYAFIGGKDTEY